MTPASSRHGKCQSPHFGVNANANASLGVILLAGYMVDALAAKPTLPLMMQLPEV
jgi:hypothetical protein